MQKITLIGNLGNDPEDRCTPTGKKVVSFSLAVNLSKDKTCWYQVNIWEDRLSSLLGLLNVLKKGSRICVVGDFIQPQAYINKNQQPAVRLVVNAHSLNFVGSPAKEESCPPVEQKPQKAEESPQYLGGYSKEYKDEDIPF